MRIVGHRGSSADFPENTVQSQRACFGKGVKGAEFDVHLSRDGEVVVLHDTTLERTASPACPPELSPELCEEGGTETQESYARKLRDTPVSELPYHGFLEHVDVGSKLHHGQREAVPLMRDLMRETVAADNFVFAELKAGETAEMVSAMVALVSSEGWSPANLVFISFDIRVVWLMKRHLPAFRSYFVTCGGGGGCTTPYTAEEAVAAARYPEVASAAFDASLGRDGDRARAAASAAAAAMDAAGAQRPASAQLDGIDLMASPHYATAEAVRRAKAHNLEVAVWVWGARHIPPDGGDSLGNARTLAERGVERRGLLHEQPAGRGRPVRDRRRPGVGGAQHVPV